MSSVADRLKQRIRETGPIPFALFMEEALYGEGGYYNRPDLPIGESGDFVTGSTHSARFARSTARLLERLDRVLGSPADFLEAGCGDGRHLASLAAERPPDRMGRLLGWDRIARPLCLQATQAAGVGRLEDLSQLSGAAHGLVGLVFSYELFDALPVNRLVGREGGLGELLVGVSGNGEFEWREGEVSDPALADLAPAELEPGQVADVALGWRPLYRRLAQTLERGLLVTIDYGFERDHLFDVRVRRHGTLACYRRHRVHRDPFVDVGEQDLTAHVDFTALMTEGEAAGLETICFTRQAPWLVALGALDGVSDLPASERVRAMQLLDLEGMGEELRVLVQARGATAGEALPAELLER